MKRKFAFRWLAFVAMCVCLLAPVSFAQVLQNGADWVHILSSSQVPTFLVPPGQASVQFSIRNAEVFNYMAL